MEKEFGRHLSKAFRMRQASTYDVYASYGEGEVSTIVDNANAEKFITKIKELLKTPRRYK